MKIRIASLSQRSTSIPAPFAPKGKERVQMLRVRNPDAGALIVPLPAVTCPASGVQRVDGHPELMSLLVPVVMLSRSTRAKRIMRVAGRPVARPSTLKSSTVRDSLCELGKRWLVSCGMS